MARRTKYGRIMYVPRPIIEEVESYCKSYNTSKRHAWGVVKERIEIGKEMERIAGIFGMRKRRR